MDERYATAREHWELREDVAGLKADMRQIGPQLTRIETMIAAKATQPPQSQAADSNTLALHHAATAMTEAVKAMASQANRPTAAAEVLHMLNASKQGRTGTGMLWAALGAVMMIALVLGYRQLIGH